MDCSMLGFPVLQCLPDFVQPCVHWVDIAIQQSHPLSLSPPAFSLSQHQGFSQWVGSSHQVAKVLELQLQHQSFQWIFRVNFLYDWLVSSLRCPRDSQESSPATKFECITSSLSLLHGTTLTSSQDYGKAIALTIWTFVGKIMSLLFNMLSGFVIAFLPRSKYLLVSLLQSPSAVMWCRFIERHICRHEKKLYVLQSVAVGSWRSLAGWRDMVHAVVDQIKIARVEQKH